MALALVFGIQASVSQQAHAVLAAGAAIAASGGTAGLLAIVGASSLVTGFAGAALMPRDLSVNTSESLAMVFSVLFWGGILLLPSDSPDQAPDLAKLEESQAAELQVTTAEINEYNKSLVRLNGAKQEITASIVSGKLTTHEQIRNAWLSYKEAGLFNDSAFLVLEKVSAKAAKTLEASKNL